MLDLLPRRARRQLPGMRSRSGRGFTLLEVMIVVVIIAILAAIALPNYSRYAYRTRRADGKNMLMAVAAAQERFYTNFNRYGSSMSDLGFASGTSEKGYYTVTSANGSSGDTQSYVLTATPQGVQRNDSCAELTISETGLKQAPHDNHTNGDCW